jgi:asparagine synthase (glutamine-hydrolysing)
MCGIAGILGPAARLDDLHRMLDRIAHRGDATCQQETAVGPAFALGTNRLAIVDPQHGKQPFQTDDGNVYCVSNGEIYNDSALRETLSRYYDFHTRCDTESILHAWEEYGQNITSHLRGMFAFAIVDRMSGLWALARDPLGIKPLYYARRDSSLFFASEVKALTALSGFNEILTLPPGTIMTAEGIIPYATIDAFGSASEEAGPELCDIRKALESAVECHLPPPGEPVAVLLSGGVDSSTVLFLSRRLHRGPVEAFTIATPQGSSDDLDASTSLCERLDVPLRVISPESLGLTEFYLSSGVYMTETFEPALVRNATTYYFLCRAVRAQGYKFCLSGEGADEIFGGYSYFQGVPKLDRDRLIRRSLLEIHQTYLQMADRASMFATLEVRVPYMDYRFVKQAIRLPTEMRVREGVDKWALRNLYVADLPAVNRLRSKVGMNAGAGYGSNDPGQGIYARAVERHYRNHSGYSADLEVVKAHSELYQLDLTNLEEVFNFARFVEAGFTKLRLNPVRPQLNTSNLRTSTNSIDSPNATL